MSPGVEPGESALHRLHLQLSAPEKLLIHSGYLKLTTCRRSDVLRYIHHFVRVEVESDHGIVGLRVCRLLLDAQTVALVVELRHPVPLRVIDPVAEYSGPALLLGRVYRILQQSCKPGPMEDVVPENQTHAVIPDKLLPDDECLGQTVRARLLGIFKPHSEIGTVTEKPAEAGKVLRRRYDKYISDSGQHEYRDRVIYHRFVIHREKLLADPLGYRIKPGAGSSGQYDAFHIPLKLFLINTIQVWRQGFTGPAPDTVTRCPGSTGHKGTNINQTIQKKRVP